jgi:brefeldin A-inhibited guanine nucleotide-exchange protein
LSVRPLGPRPRQLKKDFQQIIVKCVLQLLIIQTLTELLAVKQPSNVSWYIKSKHMMKLLECFEKSYRFARKFNSDMPLRIALYKIGFMKQLPNLLKQETTAVHSLIVNLNRLYLEAIDPSKEIPNGVLTPFDLATDRCQVADQIKTLLFGIAQDVLEQYNGLEPGVKQRNIVAWSPVVIAILTELSLLPDEQVSISLPFLQFLIAQFREQLPSLYRPTIEIMKQHDLSPEMRKTIYDVLVRLDDTWHISQPSSG